VQNIIVRRDGDKLTLEIDLSKDLGPSKSGFSRIVAKSAGRAPLTPDLMEYGFEMSCVIYKYINAEKEYESIIPKASKKKRVRGKVNGKTKKD